MVNVLIASIASTESEYGSGIDKCANTDNMSDVHCKFKRPDARLTYGPYGVRSFGVKPRWVCGFRLSVGVWHFVLRFSGIPPRLAETYDWTRS